MSDFAEVASESMGFVGRAKMRWGGRVTTTRDDASNAHRIICDRADLRELCGWLAAEMGYAFATLVVEDEPEGLRLTYVFHPVTVQPWVLVEIRSDDATAPSLVERPLGPVIDWHEREAEDLFGLQFEGHPRLGEFVLHEDWREGVNPMRKAFDARSPRRDRATDAAWLPPRVLLEAGSFAMPVGPIFSDFAESAHFLLETVGEDVVRTIPRLFYKYRGVEKIAEGLSVDRALLLAERFSGVSAFAHGLGFCQAVEAIAGIEPPPRAKALRVLFAELERLRHHAAVIAGICHSTALAIAASQAAIVEEELLRLSGEIVGHRYLFGVATLGGVSRDLSEAQRLRVASVVKASTNKLNKLDRSLRYSSSFLDRLEEVGVVRNEDALSYGLAGPVARACAVARDIRKLRPYAAYDGVDFVVPLEQEGDGYARLRIFFREARQSAKIVDEVLAKLPVGGLAPLDVSPHAGAALAAVETPAGAAIHWVRLGERGTVDRWRITPPNFANWHGFHLAAENFAFQDFPIILASFGLSNAECDR
jgi:Ni,Fe-hydrogenase III large subunit/Ni,Fe-hydrogenase III component G